MKSNAQPAGQKLKGEEYQCNECKEWKVFNPWDDKGRIQSCPACQAKHPGIVQRIKNITEHQWEWIGLQLLLSLVFLGFEQDPNAKVTPLAFVIASNFLVIFTVQASREVWPEKK